MIRLEINGKPISVDADPEAPLLWVLRDRLKLTGTKYGCGMGMCGACTVHVNGRAARSCLTKLSEWRKRRPGDRASGLSVTERSGSLGAGVVEISLDRRTGRIRVHKVWVVVDGGTIVQPEMARANVESGVVYGVSSVLKERVTVKNGAVEQSNFHNYELLKMSESPEEIHVEFVDSDLPPAGLGEIGNPFIGAAVANAFHALTGKRLYHMPFTPRRVLEALEA